MEILVLGGTGWLGRELARQALATGHNVTCLARGEAGPAATGSTLIRSDRRFPGAYDAVRGRRFDAVVEVSWQPQLVREALDALGDHVEHWTYVSSGNVYARHDLVGADESSELLAPTDLGEVGRDRYGPAKVACEQASRDRVGERLLIARCGLIGGPGDISGRTGAWVARAARDPHEPMLVPDTPNAATCAVDVRDLAAWLLRCAQDRVTGTFNAVGPTVAFQDWVALSRHVGGHDGPVVKASASWLVDQGIAQYMGPESLAMWLIEPGTQGWSARSGAAAAAAGLRHRSRAAMLKDLLDWERAAGLGRPRQAGLTPTRERELLDQLRRADPSTTTVP